METPLFAAVTAGNLAEVLQLLKKETKETIDAVSRTWGWILGRNPDKSLGSFPPCYSQSPPQFCLEISISLNSHNLLQFLQFSYFTLYRRKKENLIEKHTLVPVVSEIPTETSSLRTLKIMSRNLKKWYVHEFGFCFHKPNLFKKIDLKNWFVFKAIHRCPFCCLRPSTWLL